MNAKSSQPEVLPGQPASKTVETAVKAPSARKPRKKAVAADQKTVVSEKAFTAAKKPRKKAGASTSSKPRRRAATAVLAEPTPTGCLELPLLGPISDAASTEPTPASPESMPVIPGSNKPAKYYLTREGVAFGPYSEFQVRASIRLGVFAGNDLALADDGKEWLEVSRLLPPEAPLREPTVLTLPNAPAKTKVISEWREVADLLPRMDISAGQPPAKRPACPLPEHLLREHEFQFAARPVASFITELTRGKLGLAALPVAIVVITLLTVAAMVKQHESARARARAVAVPPSAPKLPTTQALAKTGSSLTPVSLSLSQSLANVPWTPQAPAGSVALSYPDDPSRH